MDSRVKQLIDLARGGGDAAEAAIAELWQRYGIEWPPEADE
ncbi:MAG: hypothetical protein BWX69_03163 [Planctomycetes bacterium ADurb.Bin069]|jgi:hypothetical protein|nr:MAG: hypothetical protein BWX69_03163 [Planctomycetes bacterium ADurb.Bin069]